MSLVNLVHKFIPMPQAMKMPDAKAAVDKGWKKLETIPAWNLDKDKSKKDIIEEAQQRQIESPFCNIDGHLSPQECGVRNDIDGQNHGQTFKILLHFANEACTATH